MNRLSTIAELDAYRDSLRKASDPKKTVVRICLTGCRAFGALEVKAAFDEEVKRQELGQQVEIRSTGCHGFCARAPVVAIDPEGIFYQQVAAKDVPDIISQTLLQHKTIDRLVFTDQGSGQKFPLTSEVPFYRKQTINVLHNCGKIDPTSLSHYIAAGGYSALSQVLAKWTPEKVIADIKKAGLRGRGGAGFPTGIKWEIARAAPGSVKYLVCNGDEGDPGAFMDRAVLEGDPHSVIEGMIIAAFAMGVQVGYVYVRAEYPIAVVNVKLAIAQANEAGLLGKNILGSGLNLEIRVKEGAGAFVCGEETALMASIEGKRGMPRPRPPFPAQSGLWGKPTNINNVETYANVPSIILNGADWYASMGTEKSKGTKIFSLAGKINNTGLVEVPMGISMREVIFDVGGGIPGGRKFKAVQMGGPSGGCVPEKHLGLPVDYDSLASIGSIMGSGGMVVLDEDTCMVDVARYFLGFTQSESCGKCVPCRLGTKRMLEILTRITQGQGVEGDVEHLTELAEGVRDASLCGLGQTCPNPVLSTITFFRDEYDAHIREKRCPAKACKQLMFYHIDPEKCQACMICHRNCPAKAIDGAKGLVHWIDQTKCTKCGTCMDVCPPRFDAVVKLSGVPVPPLPAKREIVRSKRGEK